MYYNIMHSYQIKFTNKRFAEFRLSGAFVKEYLIISAGYLCILFLVKLIIVVLNMTIGDFRKGIRNIVESQTSLRILNYRFLIPHQYLNLDDLQSD